MRIKTLFIILCIGFSCVKDEDKSGYNCVNNECIATFDNPTYLTLQDCQTACVIGSINPPAGTKTGTIYLYVPVSSCSYDYNNFSVSVTVGFGLSSTDVANDSYFYSKKFNLSGSVTLRDIQPGTYYYKAVRKSTNDKCAFLNTTKSGPFTVKSGQTCNVTISF